MHPVRRRKKRPNYGIRTVEVCRGKHGFGFTISGQQPCILSCIVLGSPAECAGLRAGDYLVAVNGQSVSKIPHDDVVRLIGNSSGILKLQIAENYYSDSSDEDILISRTKPKYGQRSRAHNHKSPAHNPNRIAKVVRDLRTGAMFDKATLEVASASVRPTNQAIRNWDIPVLSPPRPCNIAHLLGRKEHFFLVGYLGTIEMPKQIQTGTRNQVVKGCIKKLRTEKRSHTWVLMKIHPDGITLSGRNGNILADYPAYRITYCGPSCEEDKKYLGLVTTAVLEEECITTPSSSCHVFAVQPNIADHDKHSSKALLFKVECTKLSSSEECTEFPAVTDPILNAIRSLCLTNECENPQENVIFIANSPQPSQAGSTAASSNSDSGIGFRDDCGHQSDRIVMVDIENQRLHIQHNNSKNSVDSLNIQLQPKVSETPSLNLQQAFACVSALYPFPPITEPCSSSYDPNMRCADQNSPLNRSRSPHSIASSDGRSYSRRRRNSHRNLDNPSHQACNEQSIYYQLGLSSCSYLDNTAASRLTSKSTEDLGGSRTESVYSKPRFGESSRSVTNLMSAEEKENAWTNYKLRPQVKDSYKSVENVHSSDARSILSISTTSNKSRLFKSVEDMAVSSDKSSEILLSYSMSPKMNVTSDKSLDHMSVDSFPHDTLYKEFDDIVSNTKDQLLMYKLSPKVFGVQQPLITQSLEDLKAVHCQNDSGLLCFGIISSPRNTQWGSLQDLRSFRNLNGEDNTQERVLEEKPPVDSQPHDIVSQWSSCFEKLLEDPAGLEAFEEFLKKEFSEENIKFWIACEEYRKIREETLRKKIAYEIYETHLCDGALEPVNVDAQALQVTQDNLEAAQPDLFEQAQKQIFSLMKFDSYPRFLKSDLYKECLLHDDQKQQIEVSPCSRKLKKSRSDAEDCRRKSLLPWHRKNRSKSKDRGESEYKLSTLSQSEDAVSVKSEMTSSRSSLASWDLALRGSFSRQSITSGDTSERENCSLCRVLLPDGATTVVQIRSNESIRELIHRLLEKRALHYSTFEVYIASCTKPVALDDEAMHLSNKEVRVEQRVIFRLDLPNRKTVSVKAKANKTLGQVLRPVLHKYSYRLEMVTICQMSENEVLELTLPITSVDGKRLTVLTRSGDVYRGEPTQTGPSKTYVKSNNLDDITNKVFEELLQGKSEVVGKSEHGSMKSEDWGSEHSSGIFGKFLRRDSSAIRSKSRKVLEGVVTTKPPIISKWKTPIKSQGVSDSDELYEGLKRAQRSRLEDQRGTEINFELPDFLKDTENVPQSTKKHRKSRKEEDETSRHEKLSVNQRPETEGSSKKLDECGGRLTPKPLTCKTYETPKTTIVKCDTEDNNNTLETVSLELPPRRSDPPPLPPKPKHLPSKLSMWNHRAEPPRRRAVYLDQPSSSFV